MTEENIKLFDSELKVMDVLWKDGDVPAKYVADTLNREVGWNKNTTYTLIKRCINKGAIERTEPGFMCHALIAKEQVQDLETDELIDKIYDGSVDKLFAALLGRKKLYSMRPLMYVPEKDTKGYIKKYGLKIVKNPCPVDGKTKREEIKNLIKNLSKAYDNLETKVFNAIQRSHIEGWNENDKR